MGVNSSNGRVVFKELLLCCRLTLVKVSKLQVTVLNSSAIKNFHYKYIFIYFSVL